MILYLDQFAASHAHLERSTEGKEGSDSRHYYIIATPHGDALIVCRNGHKIEDLARTTVDCAVGWDTGSTGFVPSQVAPARRAKVTIFKPIASPGRARSLTQLLSEMRDEKNHQ